MNIIKAFTECEPERSEKMKLSREKVDLQRARKNLTIEEMASIYGVSRTRLNVILNMREITPLCAGRLAKTLGCDVSDILEEQKGA